MTYIINVIWSRSKWRIDQLINGYQDGTAHPLTGRNGTGWFRRILGGGEPSKYLIVQLCLFIMPAHYLINWKCVTR